MAKPVNTTEFNLIRRRLPHWRARVILDVGANVGQSALGFAAALPEAIIHSFEPFPDSFRKLALNTAHLPNVMTHKLGLGSADAVMLMSVGPNSTKNYLISAADPALTTVEVEIRQGAALLDALAIPNVSYLKIDTEGHDLDVLMGLKTALRRIDFIQVEAGMNPYNKTHVPYALLADFMFENNFLLFHFFEQAFEFKKGGRPVLRRTNPLFINANLVDLKGID